MVNENFESVPSSTEGVGEVAGGRRCPKCGQSKQWRNRQWVCLDHDNAVPANWKHPMSGGLVVKGGMEENDKVEIVKESTDNKQALQPIQLQTPTNSKGKNSIIEIPTQAREVFQKLVWNVLKVELSEVQAENLLNMLYEMPTPTKMSDAKAIIKLINSLEELKGE